MRRAEVAFSLVLFVIVLAASLCGNFWAWKAAGSGKVVIEEQKKQIASLTRDITFLVSDKEKMERNVFALSSALYDAEKYKEMVVRGSSIPVTSMVEYTIAIEPGASIEQLIASGGYSWSDPNFNSVNFPIRQVKIEKEILRIVLVNFSKIVTSEEVIFSLKKAGMRPAREHELLALGAVEKEACAIALGTVWEDPYGHWYIPAVWKNVNGRGAGLDLFHTKWRAYCVFAAVRGSDMTAEEEP